MPTILIIEDETKLRQSLARFLKIQDFEVLVAQNGQEGLSLAQVHLPDLIICDIMMPEMDGYTVKQKLGDEIQTDVIPFIFLTAKATFGELRHGMNLGADDYITKPFKFADVLVAIEARLKRRNTLAQTCQLEMQQLEGLLKISPVSDEPSVFHSEGEIQQRFQQYLKGMNDVLKYLPLLLFETEQYLEISNHYGHTIANILTVEIAKYFQRCLQQNFDVKYAIARVDTSHLAVLLAPTKTIDGVTAIAQKFLTLLDKSLTVNQEQINVQGCIGIALARQDGEDWETLLSHAEIALSTVRNTKQNQYQYYSPSLQRHLSRRYQIAALLRTAIEKQEFELYFQPQISVKQQQIVGAEALIRWPESALGPISPVEFIPIAEQSAVIHDIGAWVLRAACQQAVQWHQEGMTNFKVSVNVSSIQFYDPELVQRVKSILIETELPPNCLELELTEGALVQNPEETDQIMQQLRDLGICLSIDDFGTGYSSLSYLQSLPFQTLKIDRCFIRKITQNADSLAIVKTIIQLAQNLDLDIIAEGVEQEAELNLLTETGCDIVQGYLFSPPRSAAQFKQFLKEFSWKTGF